MRFTNVTLSDAKQLYSLQNLIQLLQISYNLKCLETLMLPLDLIGPLVMTTQENLRIQTQTTNNIICINSCYSYKQHTIIITIYNYLILLAPYNNCNSEYYKRCYFLFAKKQKIYTVSYFLGVIHSMYIKSELSFSSPE